MHGEKERVVTFVPTTNPQREPKDIQHEYFKTSIYFMYYTIFYILYMSIIFVKKKITINEIFFYLLIFRLSYPDVMTLTELQ